MHEEMNYDIEKQQMKQMQQAEKMVTLKTASGKAI